jgi:hypothetical protein
MSTLGDNCNEMLCVLIGLLGNPTGRLVAMAIGDYISFREDTMEKARDVQIILGAGGAAGTPLSEELLRSGKTVRTVSRSGRGPGGAERRIADLTELSQIEAVVEEGATVYLLAGLPYDRRVWQVQWPVIMKNVVTACCAKSARLVFLDNVYLYGRVKGNTSNLSRIFDRL